MSLSMDSSDWDAAVRAAELDRLTRRQTVLATVTRAMGDGVDDALELLQLVLETRGGVEGWAELPPAERRLVLSTWATVRSAISRVRGSRG